MPETQELFFSKSSAETQRNQQEQLELKTGTARELFHTGTVTKLDRSYPIHATHVPQEIHQSRQDYPKHHLMLFGLTQIARMSGNNALSNFEGSGGEGLQAPKRRRRQ